MSNSNENELKTGWLKTIRSGAGFLRDPDHSLQRRDNDIYVPNKFIDRYNLTDGASVTGPVSRNNKGLKLDAVESVCGVDPDRFSDRRSFDDLTALKPTERFNLSASNELSMRILDLLVPIGKGTRSLIVSPPRAGKTTILEQLATGIYADAPECDVIVFLIDERPEEVTQFKRNTPEQVQVIASSNDQSVEDHVNLTEMMMQHTRSALECGKDLVLLVDSLTRLARTHNLAGSGDTGRTMSGGIDAGAMETPRRFFGLARDTEEGGSLTMIATALKDTGSQMDEVIFEEFKGTGNSELVLDRSLADKNIYPAIDIQQSGTRNDEKLHSEQDYEKINRLRRQLLDMENEEAIQQLRSLLEEHKTKDEFLSRIP